MHFVVSNGNQWNVSMPTALVSLPALPFDPHWSEKMPGRNHVPTGQPKGRPTLAKRKTVVEPEQVMQHPLPTFQLYDILDMVRDDELGYETAAKLGIIFNTRQCQCGEEMFIRLIRLNNHDRMVIEVIK